MFHTGRWKHYYSEENFLRSMRESIQLAERWALIAPPLSEMTVSGSEPSALGAEPNFPRGNAT
jgi:hypothetical protein